MVDTGRVQNNWREFSLEPISPPSSLVPSIAPHVIVIPSFTRPRYMICAAGLLHIIQRASRLGKYRRRERP